MNDYEFMLKISCSCDEFDELYGLLIGSFYRFYRSKPPKYVDSILRQMVDEWMDFIERTIFPKL